MPGNLELWYTRPVLDKFPVPGGMDTATVESLLPHGLAELKRDGLAKNLWDNGEYSLWIFPKIVPSLPYEAMVTLLPHENNLRVSLFNELSQNTLTSVLRVADRVKDAVVEVALENGHVLHDMYIFQHVGPYDLNPKTSFNTSFAPLHLHIHGYPAYLDEFPVFAPSDVDLKGKENKHILRDPLIPLYHEAFAILGWSVYEANAQAIGIETENSMNWEIDADTLIKLMNDWQSIWAYGAHLMTDRVEGNHGRYKVLDEGGKLQRLSAIKQGVLWQKLSRKNRERLEKYTLLIKDAGDDPWEWMYKGVNGTIGYKFTHNKRQLRVVPRTFTSWYRHFLFIDGRIVIKKDKLNGSVDDETKRVLLPIQRRIIDKL